jgi:PAS domain-containing protein
MIDPATLAAILDSIQDPVLFADVGHTTRYMNRAAIAHYKEGEALLGRSLLDCHNARSQAIMKEVLLALEAGEEERLITDDERRRIYMRAVRSPGGVLLGYYERYAPPAAPVSPAPPAPASAPNGTDG